MVVLRLILWCKHFRLWRRLKVRFLNMLHTKSAIRWKWIMTWISSLSLGLLFWTESSLTHYLWRSLCILVWNNLNKWLILNFFKLLWLTNIKRCYISWFLMMIMRYIFFISWFFQKYILLISSVLVFHLILKWESMSLSTLRMQIRL